LPISLKKTTGKYREKIGNDIPGEGSPMQVTRIRKIPGRPEMKGGGKKCCGPFGKRMRVKKNRVLSSG